MKTPLVLVSGLLSNEDVWRHQTRHLADIVTIHVISPSQDTPQKMVQAILDEAPPKFALAGHSMGGWLCLEVMKRASSRVSQLCLLNTTAETDPEEKRMQRQEMMQKTKRGQFREVVQKIVEGFVFNSPVKNELEEMFLCVGEEAFLRQQKAMMEREECVSVLPKITCSTLVIHAAQDRVFSLEEHRKLAGQIRSAKLAIVEGSGHMSPMEKPEEITNLLCSWLNW